MRVVTLLVLPVYVAVLCIMALVVEHELVHTPLQAAPQHVVAEQLDAIGYELLTVTNAAAVGFTAATSAEARAAACTLEGTATLRYRYDGTAPTTTEGHLATTPSATAPVALTIQGRNNVVRFRTIATAGNATLRCTYLR